MSLFIRTLKKNPLVLDKWDDTIWTILVEKNHIRLRLGDKQISQIKPTDIQKFNDQLVSQGNTRTQTGLSSGTIRSIHSC